MNKHIEHALKEWAEAKEYDIDTCRKGRRYYWICPPKGKSSISFTLNLNWWREVPIRDEDTYIKQLLIILGVDESIFTDAVMAHILELSNATIPQRCEAKYKADMG